jgi:hypothetical protein
MKLNTLMVINTVISAVFGIAFVLVPAQVLQLYGITADAPFKMVGQLFGAALIGFAVLTWSARSAADSVARRAIVLALFVGDGIGFIVALVGQLAGVVNALGWSTVIIYLLLAVGFGYIQFTQPASP